MPPAAASAAEPTTTPLLRIETGMHTALVQNLVHDAKNNRLVTSSDDKSIRIWQLPEGRLRDVLRFPIDEGQEGRIFALAVSPDGRLIVAGGWTGWDWDQRSSIYVFDADSGELVRRIQGFPETLSTLAFSRDGKLLAVGLQARGGFQLLRTNDWSPVARDTEYFDKVLGIDFAPDGRSAVSALDGYIRIYDPQGKIIARRKSAPGTKPVAIRFSPDGSLLAVGFFDVARVAVLSMRDFSSAFEPDLAALRGQETLQVVNWDSTGRYLYAAGWYRGAGPTPIYRWGNGGRGALERIPVSDQRVSEIIPLPGGAMAWSAEDPVIGVLGADGKPLLSLPAQIANYREAGQAFRVSQDGAVVRFPLAAQGGRPMRFSLFEKNLQPLLSERNLQPAAAEERALAPPLQGAAGFKLENWRNAYGPVLNGSKLALDDYEMSRSHAVSPDQLRLALGTEWALRLYDRDASLKWRTPLAALAWEVNVTGDGRSVVAALADGTIRWYRIEDGIEYFALFPHGAGEEWIAWTPQGYYVSSNYGDNFVGWHLNRGKERAAEFFRAVQFERILYRPDVVEERFRSRGREQGLASRRAAEQFDVRQLAAIAPPRIRILDLAPAQPRDGAARAKLRFAVERNSIAMQDYGVFVNNMPLTPASRRRLAGKEASSFSREFEFDVTGRDNLIRIEVGNGSSVGLVEKFYALPGAAASRTRRGDLYLLAVGVNQFTKLSGANLAYAARDAEEVEKFFRTQGGPGRYYRAVHTRLITDNTEVKPERARILEALAFIEAAGPRDTVVVFLASHGISDATGAYYFVPRDASTEDVNTVLRGADRPVTSLVAWTSFFDSLRRVAGRRVLIVDTCQAKNIEGRLDLHSLAKRSASSLFNLVVASKGNEESQEYPPAKHGLFTYALLDGLKGASDADRDGFITLQEAFRYTLPMVERLRNRIGPQSPQIMAPEPLGSIVLARVGGGAAVAAPPPVENAGCGVRTLLIGKRDPRCAQ